MTNGEVVLDHINVKRKLKGKSSWNSIAITMYDAIMPSGAQSVMEWARLAHESVTGRDGYSDFYKKDITLEILGTVGDIVGEWIIKGAFCKVAKFGDYDWSQGESAISLNITLAMDYCVCNF